MPLQNRVTPLGELVADPARGLVYGNRGCLHDEAGRIRRRYASKRWIACRLRFRDWHRAPLMQPGRFTELFFLDEVTAFAAGHRPCALCRREDYDRFVTIWEHASSRPGRCRRNRCAAPCRTSRSRHARAAPVRSRVRRASRRRFRSATTTSPSWCSARSCCAGRRPATSRPHRDRERERALLITPPSLVSVLRAGWEPLVPLLHPSAESTPPD